MATEAEIPVEERIIQVLQRLGIQNAHFGGSAPSDWQGLVTAHPEVISSLTLVTPRSFDSTALETVASRLLVFGGDKGNSSETLRNSVAGLPDAVLIPLTDYQRSNTADVVAERSSEIGPAFVRFLDQQDSGQGNSEFSRSGEEGEAAGILYSIRGSGPPVVLLPIEYASSQWDPILPLLAQRYSTITLGGGCLGQVANLESRIRGGYLDVVGKVVEETQLQPGERVLDVGCGPGGIDRWLARHTNRANPIVGMDISSYLLREAAALVRSEGLEGVIEFREGSAEGLPFPDNSFDVSLSFTVIQAVDADRMLNEMLRVTRPGGRVGVLARGDDRPNITNLSVRPELRAKAEAPRDIGDTHSSGCCDDSLYRRFIQAGLSQVKMFPQLATYTDRTRLRIMQQNQIIPALSSEEAEEWRAAVAQAEAAGTFFIAQPFHCAVGTKPA